MSDVAVWFANWMGYHQSLHPDRRWVDPETSQGFDFYEGWIEAFEEIEATEKLARMASKKLQTKKFYFNEHLAKILEIIGDLKRTQPAGPSVSDAPDPELLAASHKSANCPECHGSGWELKRAIWHTIPRPFIVQVACHCPAGRWRKAHGEDPNPDPEFDGLWHYMEPDEVAPEPMQPQDLARRLARKADTSKPPFPKTPTSPPEPRSAPQGQNVQEDVEVPF
jgi:hypothetical protein